MIEHVVYNIKHVVLPNIELQLDNLLESEENVECISSLKHIINEIYKYIEYYSNKTK